MVVGLLTLGTMSILTACAPPHPAHPVIGAKNFTEQVILGELLAQEIEARSHLKVERRFYLAGSYICHQALVAGRIDAYVEYTGTALTAILKQPLDRDPESVLHTVRTLYASRFHITAADPLGFENTFAMVIRSDDADPQLPLRRVAGCIAQRAEMEALGIVAPNDHGEGVLEA